MTPTAVRLRDRIVAAGRRTLGLAELQVIFLEVEPALAVAPRRRVALLELLDELVGHGELELTKSNPDRFALPPLPRSVTVLGVAPRPVAPRPPAPVWRPELSWTSSLRLTPAEVGFLLHVDRFLRDLDPNEPVVPMKERSLELMGDEKQLDRLRGGRLFAPGRLSPALLRYEEVHPPFVYARVGSEPVALVIENHQTYHSFLRVPEVQSGIGFVVYGAGNHITGSVSYFAEISPRVEAIRYFGDLDLEGLEIPRRANRVSQTLGLPPVVPAADLYRLLLRVGTRADAEPAASQAAEPASQWLPSDLHREVVDLLTGGHRIAQEWVGLKVLRARAATRSGDFERAG